MKQAVLRAARQLFGEVGYERATIRDIARRAGVTHPTVTHHFASKQSLYESLLERTVRDMAATATASAEGSDDPRAKIESFLRAGIALDADDHSVTRFVTASLVDSSRYPELSGSSDAQFEQVRSFLRTVLDDGRRSGALRADLDIDSTTEMLVALMWGMALYGAFIGDSRELSAAADQFRLLLRGELW